jgi:hypothetical protein
MIAVQGVKAFLNTIKKIGIIIVKNPQNQDLIILLNIPTTPSARATTLSGGWSERKNGKPCCLASSFGNYIDYNFI